MGDSVSMARTTAHRCATCPLVWSPTKHATAKTSSRAQTSGRSCWCRRQKTHHHSRYGRMRGASLLLACSHSSSICLHLALDQAPSRSSGGGGGGGDDGEAAPDHNLSLKGMQRFEGKDGITPPMRNARNRIFRPRSDVDGALLGSVQVSPSDRRSYLSIYSVCMYDVCMGVTLWLWSGCCVCYATAGGPECYYVWRDGSKHSGGSDRNRGGGGDRQCEKGKVVLEWRWVGGEKRP